MKYFLIIFISFSVPIFSEDDNWKSLGKVTFNCVVKDQIILRIEDGESERFSGYEGGLKTGDRHSLKVEWFDIREHKNQVPSDKDKIGVKISQDGNHGSTLYFNRMNDLREMNDVYRLSFPRGFQTLIDMRLSHNIFGDDLQLSNSLIYEPKRNRSFIRYYKNDWDYHYATEEHILVSNCMNAKGDVSKLINDSISLFKN